SEFLAFPPRGTTLAWYAKVLSDAGYVAAFRTSSVLAATAIALCLGIPAAIARHEFAGRGAVAALLMSPLVLPHVVLRAPLLRYAAVLGLVRTFAMCEQRGRSCATSSCRAIRPSRTSPT